MPDYLARDGLRLHYTDDGAGMPLICLAGLTRDGRDFDYLAPHLDRVRLIRPDYRGRGGSDWPADPATYAVAVEAGDVLALMDHLHLAKAAILGTSRGGLVAMVLAATAKDRLGGVCLNDIGPAVAPAGIERIMGYLGIAPRFGTRDAMAAAMPALMPGFQGVPASRWAEEVERHTTLTASGLGLTYDPRLRDATIAGGATPAPDLWPLFDALDGLPLALIRGANSDLLSPATAAEMVRRRPDAIFAEVPGRAHVPFLDEPGALDAIRAWLETIR